MKQDMINYCILSLAPLVNDSIQSNNFFFRVDHFNERKEKKMRNGKSRSATKSNNKTDW